MRFVIRKIVNAKNAREAISKDRSTPVHEVYIKDGEDAPGRELKPCIGFTVAQDQYWRDDEIR